jgi:hypothetical protein
MEKSTLRINKVAGVNMKLIIQKFGKQINFLKRNNVDLSEILSDIYVVILTCSKNYDNLRGSFYNYLYSSLRSSFSIKINEILKLRNNSRLKDDIAYSTQDPLSVLISKYPEVENYILYKPEGLDLDINLINLCEEHA